MFVLKKIKKGQWPLFVSILLFFAVIVLNFILLEFDKSEFRGLGMMFLHIFIITPFFLITPALLRIPAANNIKPMVKVMQFFVYGLLILSWFVLFLS